MIIVEDRYKGAYSNALWLCVWNYFFILPALEDDITAMNFWHENANHRDIGFGNTPDEAYRNLLSKAKG